MKKKSTRDYITMLIGKSELFFYFGKSEQY
jgi:hypothetical protein